MLPALGHAGQVAAHIQRPGHTKRRQRCGKHKGAHGIDQIFAHHPAAHHKGAAGGQGLAERTHQQVDVGHTTDGLGQAQPRRALHAYAVSFVHVEQNVVVRLFQADQARQVGAVAVHAVNALYHHKHRLVTAGLAGQDVGQALVVLMREAHKIAPRQTQTVNQTGMHQFVGHHQGVRVAQRRQDAGIGMEAAAHHQGRLLLIMVGKPLLQFLVHVEITGQQARGRRRQATVFLAEPLPEILPRIPRCGRQTQIVVGRQIQHPSPGGANILALVTNVRQLPPVSLLLPLRERSLQAQRKLIHQFRAIFSVTRR